MSGATGGAGGGGDPTSFAAATTSQATTGSSSFVLVPTMTHTPGAGNYLFAFSCVWNNSGEDVIDFSGEAASEATVTIDAESLGQIADDARHTHNGP